MAALGWSPTVDTYLGRVPKVLGWRRDGAGPQPGAVAADRASGGLRQDAEGERAGGDGDHRQGIQPTDRQPHRAQDPAEGDRGIDRGSPDGAGAGITRSAPLFRHGPGCPMRVGPRPGAAEIAPFRHGRACRPRT
jgi:hypothetical protein